MSTATARSSLPRPFSIILREVAASCVAQPILATKYIQRADWTSACGQEWGGFESIEGRTLKFQDIPDSFIDTCDARVFPFDDLLPLR